MPRILIAGCGYVGQATADLFHEAGWTVEGWTCSRESAGRLAGKPYPVYALDITNRVEVCTRIATFDAVIHCASSGGGDADTYHQIYFVVDDQPIRQSECYRWLAQKLNRPVPPVGKSTRRYKRGDSNKRVSNAKLRKLGWTPRYPSFADAMEKSILSSFGQS